MNQATTVTSSLDPSVVGQQVTFTATVSARGAGSRTPTGTVTFTDASTTLGTATLSAAGTATLTTSQLPVGSQTITASYGGGAGFQASSGSVTQQVGSGGEPVREGLGRDCLRAAPESPPAPH